jgi:hypothetical protein
MKQKIELNQSTVSNKSESRFSLFLKWFLLVYIFIAAFPVRMYPITTGLDPSWVIAINYFVAKHIIFGKDVVWAYGPLGFLVCPVNISSNMIVAVIFQLSLWVIFSGLMTYLFLKKTFSLLQLFLFAGVASAFSYFIRNDYFIAFLILFLLCLSWFFKRWYAVYILALLLSVLLWFIKFSSAGLSLAAVALFILVTLFKDRRKALGAAGLAGVGIPLLFVLGYLFYNPSWGDMLSYLRGAYEISAGYNVALSITGRNIELILALIVAWFYVLLMFLLYKAKEESFYLSLVFTVPLFVVFKHGFVRQDKHAVIFFSFMLLVYGLIFLFTQSSKVIKKGIFLIMIPAVVSWFFACNYYYPPPEMLNRVTGIPALKKMISVIKYTRTQEALNLDSYRNLQANKLPEYFLSKIGTKRIDIFPWEGSYVAANDLNYAPAPMFHSYLAYRPYLDFLNARHLENPSTAPELILMEWKAIDGRHPLMDAPAMWLSLYKWYDVYEKNDELLLLRRRTVPRFTYLEPMGKKEYRSKDMVEIPVADSPVIVKIYMNTSARGKLTGIFFRIPEVWIALVKQDASVSPFRMVPDTLEDGLFINFLPLNLQETEALLSHKQAVNPIQKFWIYGRGYKYYQDKITVEFFKIPELKIEKWMKKETLPSLASLSPLSASTIFSIDAINNYVFKVHNGKKSITLSKDEPFLTVKGWAVDAQAKALAGGVYLELDHKLYPASYKLYRPDVAAHFQVPAYKHSGFEGDIPIYELEPGRHILTLKILTKDKKAYYNPPETVVLEIKR